MSAIVTQRSELLFLYDVKRCNPNGDPMDANRPRIDEESGKCLVTDVRLKRTVRDYLMTKGYDGTNPGKDIFIRDVDDKPVTGPKRAEAYADKKEFISKFIDVRLFGGVSAAKGKSFNLTGPVQFGMGVSLHKVKENFIKGTGAFATSEGAEQRTFREEYNITYGLIGFQGVINENAAKHTQLTQTDVDELLDALWNGTKNLLTRSKKGHLPRLLVKIDYHTPNYFIGDLLERLSLLSDKAEEAFEDVTDFTLDTAALNAALDKHREHINNITVWQDERLLLSQPIKTQ
ncbi:MAG TPA: type I-B CRISPR-associated protein Cas7/Csh2 [Chitinophagales bacterium]|nr:type I-B CRISPR-associated protein Cas7/Csh2 [Chitinophagales bacterium]HRK28437.1 type I-B CRISPR-associated protein Cas7/Csh2 [Chitinophagales bacterium]